jgi:hypothetical protein
MRVKISYSVDLEDVPLKVQENLQEARRLLELIDESLLQANSRLTDNNTMGCSRDLEQVLTLLSKVADATSDCNSIVNGYQTALLQIKENELAEAARATQTQGERDEQS